MIPSVQSSFSSHQFMRVNTSISSAVLMLVAFLFIPFSASAQNSDSYGLRDAEWSAQRIISTFANIAGSTNSSFDNSSIGATGFDFAALVSHFCYQPAGEFELESCSRRFGIYGNLKAAIQTSEVRSLLVDTFGPRILDVLATVTQQRDDLQAKKEAARQRMQDIVPQRTNLRDRSLTLWNECKSLPVRSAAICFQKNIRLIDKLNVAVIANMRSR